MPPSPPAVAATPVQADLGPAPGSALDAVTRGSDPPATRQPPQRGGDFRSKLIDNPTLAGFLSLVLFGGAGQFFLGQQKKGGAMMAGGFFLMMVGCCCGTQLPVLIFLGLFALAGFNLVGAVDSYMLAEHLRGGGQLEDWTFFWSLQEKK